MKISLLGAGAWGTALAILFANSGHSVKLWCRNQQLAQQMQNQRINNKLLPDFILPKNIAVTANFDDLFVDNAFKSQILGLSGYVIIIVIKYL